MAAEIDAKREIAGESRGLGTAVGLRQLTGIKGIGIDFRAEDIVLGKGVAPLDAHMGRKEAAEAATLVLQGKGAVERGTIE